MKKILCVDDDPVVLRYLQSLLMDNGYAVHTAENAKTALALVDEARPDLITLDLQMPEQWGPRFYREMTRNPANRQIPVIVISGLSSSRYSIAKAAGYLSKPFEPDALLDMVAAQIGPDPVRPV
ncbi:MAG: response regulator [Desulfatitalea sp.]|nr:response regulator [Desulfatitalea sp.]NNJ99207.1 response regulator [Desulfatitalea sp.]